jgi:hypothetical protein
MDIPLNPEVAALVEALNTFDGVETISSCCGYGKDVFNIWLIVEELDALPELLWHIDGCHTGVYGWGMEVTTDCAGSPVHFRLHSEAKGEQAYSEAVKIAEYMMNREL